jgi:hypothetical protein
LSIVGGVSAGLINVQQPSNNPPITNNNTNQIISDRSYLGLNQLMINNTTQQKEMTINNNPVLVTPGQFKQNSKGSS